ncbi:MAG TPA: PilZ domain-containing protein, partial [Bdellovibrionales bacterium]|nr:PilZ domain-containing protein [Bdellovibrionales bacterium]
CQEGDLRWQPIGAIAEFYEDVRQLKGRHKESPPLQETPVQEPAPRRPLFEDAPGDPTHTTLVVEKSTTSERRTARRYDRSFHFRVRAGEGKYFATRTSDVSMTGLSLQDSLPTWIQKKFRAELAHNQGSIEIICERISDTQLKIEETANWEALRAWIVSW